MNEDINEYMTFFKEQTLKEKQSIIYEQLQMLAGFTNNLCKELNIPNEPILNIVLSGNSIFSLIFGHR